MLEDLEDKVQRPPTLPSGGPDGNEGVNAGFGKLGPNGAIFDGMIDPTRLTTPAGNKPPPNIGGLQDGMISPPSARPIAHIATSGSRAVDQGPGTGQSNRPPIPFASPEGKRWVWEGSMNTWLLFNEDEVVNNPALQQNAEQPGVQNLIGSGPGQPTQLGLGSGQPQQTPIGPAQGSGPGQFSSILPDTSVPYQPPTGGSSTPGEGGIPSGKDPGLGYDPRQIGPQHQGPGVGTTPGEGTAPGAISTPPQGGPGQVGGTPGAPSPQPTPPGGGFIPTPPQPGDPDQPGVGGGPKPPQAPVQLPPEQIDGMLFDIGALLSGSMDPTQLMSKLGSVFGNVDLNAQPTGVDIDGVSKPIQYVPGATTSTPWGESTETPGHWEFVNPDGSLSGRNADRAAEAWQNTKKIQEAYLGLQNAIAQGGVGYAYQAATLNLQHALQTARDTAAFAREKELVGVQGEQRLSEIDAQNQAALQRQREQLAKEGDLQAAQLDHQRREREATQAWQKTMTDLQQSNAERMHVLQAAENEKYFELQNGFRAGDFETARKVAEERRELEKRRVQIQEQQNTLQIFSLVGQYPHLRKALQESGLLNSVNIGGVNLGSMFSGQGQPMRRLPSLTDLAVMSPSEREQTLNELAAEHGVPADVLLASIKRGAPGGGRRLG